MTNNDGPDDKASGTGGKEQRPYATLDLKASEVRTEKEKDKGRVETEAASQAPDETQASESSGGSERAAPPPSSASGGSSGNFMTHMAAGGLGAILAIVLGFWLFSNEQSVPVPAFTKEEADTLRAQLSDANERLTALEGDLQRAAASADQASALQTELSSLEQRVAAVETRPVVKPSVTEQSVQQSIDPLSAQLADIDSRVAALAAAQKERRVSGKSMAASLAFYNLQQAIRNGTPYSVELKSVTETSPIPLELTQLESWSTEGVPTLDQLKQRFDIAEKAAIDSENQPADDSFAAEVWSQARSFVRIRRKGDVEGESTAAILARTGYRLEQDNLREALAEAEKLDGVAAQTVAPWIEALKRKIAAETALAETEAALLNSLSGEDAAKRDG